MDHIYLLRYKYIEIVVHFIGNAPVANKYVSYLSATHLPK